MRRIKFDVKIRMFRILGMKVKAARMYDGHL